MQSLVYRRMIILLILLTSGLGILLWADKYRGMSAPILIRPTEGQSGAFGPVVLSFDQPVNRSRIEPYLKLEPNVAGKWSWEGNQASFRPDQALTTGQTYTLRLLKGASDEQSHILKKNVSWIFTIRPAAVVFLGQVASNPEVWLAEPTNGAAMPLTATGGKVQDFAIFPSGEWVAFSAKNESGGIDLWVVDRKGENAHKLLDCGEDACVQPSVAPDETTITFSRRSEQAPQGEVWMIDPVTKKSEVLYADQTISGIEPNWSPQGRYLQFYDPEFAQLRVLDLASDRVILIPTNQQAVGSWSPDGEKLLFTRAESSEFGPPFVRVYEADLLTGDIRLVEISSLGQVDSSRPIFSPDGTSLVMALRSLAGSANKQLWLVALDGSAVQAITDDPVASFAAYVWDPNGEQLAFQRLQLESSQSRPQVMLWQRKDGTVSVLAEDAAWPQWLP